MILQFKDKMPIVDPTSIVFPGAVVTGDVVIGKHVGIWYNSVIRGDMEYIKIGDYTNIQDGTIIHTNKGIPTHIGNHVTIGHMSIIHAATIEDHALIGMGSIILDGAIVKSHAIVAAGTVVPPGKVVESKTLVMGNPMKFVRMVTEKEIEDIKKNNEFYVQLINEYKNNK
ncbi:MAG: gamma carbonic anhydrase family protein [Tenericutes bacterium HGW-Tenericutes-2]|jgi:carbonic anhydrase/acetyltransferase-like protein (isoleucine patch superfamily)|nr:MAG: gamma carbonic anhydrase family protein [Tenericutes bacterium HGW-Tenericutes-2]